jgi:hypothetical protein
MPGTMPRDDGGSGMREVGAALPAGRGTILTGRGTTLTGAGGATEGAGSDAEVSLGSFSSPIVAHARCARRTLTRSVAPAHDFPARGAVVEASVGDADFGCR